MLPVVCVCVCVDCESIVCQYVGVEEESYLVVEEYLLTLKKIFWHDLENIG